MPTFKDLKIYQEAIRLMLEIQEICKKLPKEEKFQLIDQAARSSSSVPDNIAEGYNDSVAGASDLFAKIRGIHGYKYRLQRSVERIKIR